MDHDLLYLLPFDVKSFLACMTPTGVSKQQSVGLIKLSGGSVSTAISPVV